MAAEIRLAGCSNEDHIGDPDAPIYEFNLAVERIEAASDAGRQLPGDFVFTARCANILWGRANPAAVIERLQAYESAGADVVYAPGLANLDSIRSVYNALHERVNVVMIIRDKSKLPMALN